MRSVFVDTSAFVALRNGSEAEHERARAALARLDLRGRGALHLELRLRRDLHGAAGPGRAARRRSSGGRRFRAGAAIELVRVEPTVEDEAWEILERHRDKRWSYVDATSFALIERDGGGEAFALDSHFAAARPACRAGARRRRLLAAPRDRLARCQPRAAMTARRPTSGRSTIDPGFVAHRRRLGADLARRDAGDLHRLGQRLGAELDGGPRQRLGDRRVRDAARLDRRAQGARLSRGSQDGRGVEIQRLIGRSLRVVVDFEALGERSVYVDCDVLAGRRRHPLRGDHRRLRRPAPGAAEAGRREEDRGDAADRLGGGGQRRHGRRAGPLRPRLRARTPAPRSTPTW